MADLTKYNPLVAWFSLAESVYQLTRETVDDVATFRMTVKYIDPNNVGKGLKEIGYTFTDNIGVPYRIIAVDTNTIDVSDEFRQGCPINDKIGIVHKSAYKGYSVHLPSELLYRLHPMAASNNNKFAMAILWGNDPNAKKIAFTSVMQPSIADYRADVVDMDGDTINPMEDYGQNPKFEIWIDNMDGTYPKQQLEPQITRSLTDGFIDSVIWSSTGDLLTGYIIISK